MLKYRRVASHEAYLQQMTIPCIGIVIMVYMFAQLQILLVLSVFVRIIIMAIVVNFNANESYSRLDFKQVVYLIILNRYSNSSFY